MVHVFVPLPITAKLKFCCFNITFSYYPLHYIYIFVLYYYYYCFIRCILVKWMFTCRWALAFIGFFGFVLLYALRVDMSVAIVCMINNTALQEQQLQSRRNQLGDADQIYTSASNLSETLPVDDEVVCQTAANSTIQVEIIILRYIIFETYCNIKYYHLKTLSPQLDIKR